MPKPPRHEFLCPVCTSIGLKHRGIPQTLDFTAKNNPGESLHRGLSSRATPAAQGYKDSNLEMTESESVALPFGDSPMSCYLKYYTRSISNLQYPNSNFFKFFYFSILLFFYFPNETYAKTINIEANTMIDMAGKKYIPAVVKYTRQLADAVVAVREATMDLRLGRPRLAASATQSSE